MKEIHENQLGEVLPCQFKPVLSENIGSRGAESDSESESSSDDDFEEAFEAENSWRLKFLSCTVPGIQRR